MEKDLDTKLYREYLSGDPKAFELLYTKYKKSIEYFVFNIVKNQEKAEEIVHDVFVDIIKNEIKEEYSFKYHIFLLAKSKALNYLKLEKRRNEINEKYIYYENNKIEKDTLEIVTKAESKKELLGAINMLDDKYKNAIYLVKIEELSYKEAAEILGETIQNVKNLVHRGKKELRNILIKKGIYEINKASKILVIVICITIALSGIAYAATQIIRALNRNSNVSFLPTYQSQLHGQTTNSIWVGTFELAWQELAKKVGKRGKIELNESVEIVNQLNKTTFSKNMLSKDNYSTDISENASGGYKIYAELNKKLNFIHVFDNFSNDFQTYTFGKNNEQEENIKYFGINSGSSEKLNENVEVLFYNTTDEEIISNDFAVILKTIQGDEIILYRTDDIKTFDEYYTEIKEKAKQYSGKKSFEEDDELLIPYINANGIISYDELIGKTIKNTDIHIEAAVQNVNFYLNEKGCNLQSQATMITGATSITSRYFAFTDTFVLFMREKEKSIPYFALKIDNSDILERKEENNKVQLFDYTMVSSEKITIQDGEYKFYEDESYEYFYPNQKTKYVLVFYKEGTIGIETAEEALKARRISIELLDKYGVEYIRRKK